MGLLDSKVAIVTGGGRGIGRQHCLELARQGAAVVVNDPGVGVHGEASGESPAEAVAREITEQGGRAVANTGSVTSWVDCGAAVEQALTEFGRLDIVVNNAGILRDRMITSLTEQDFDAVIAVHLKGSFAMTRHACDHWRSEAKAGKGAGGRIINTTSSAGMIGNVGQAAYSSAKAGIIGLTLVTALEMERYAVTCNAVSPVAVTRMSADLVAAPAADEDSDEYNAVHPRTSSPVVAYLASDAAGWLTGQVFRIEGNTVIRMDGWQQSVASRHSATKGGFLQAEELLVGMRRVYGAYPAPLVSPLK
jgi:NAD(P)-dependent dehydrogenase (short-subunit alcohol dehydrogenase family)